VSAPIAPDTNKNSAGSVEWRNLFDSRIAHPSPPVATSTVPPSAGKRSNKKAKVTKVTRESRVTHLTTNSKSAVSSQVHKWQ